MPFLKRLDRATLTVIALLLAVVLFFAVNIFSNAAFRNASLDLTQGGLYSLSPGTRGLLAHLKEPITLRFYYSKRLGDAAPTYAAYAARVRELIERYAAIAGGRIRLEFYNPEPYSDAEDRAVNYGLQGVPLNESGDTVYFGLAGSNSTDDEQSIAFFQPDRERFLEYDLTKLIAALANPKKPVIGLISSLPMQGNFGNPMMGQPSTPPWTIMQEMNDQFTVHDLGDKPDRIDKDVDLLMIVHPKELPDKTRFAIDQFVLAGGRALVLVDPNSEADAAAAARGMMMMGATASDLPQLFQSWGLRLVPDKVAGDRTMATRVAADIEGRQQAVDYVAWLSVDADHLDHNDVATGDLSTLLMATPGILEKTKDATTSFTPLAWTSAEATEIPADEVRMFPDFLKLLADYKPVGHPLVLAVRVQGMVHTAFPDGPPGAKKSEPKKKPEANKTESPKAEATKAEATKPEPPKTEATKPEANKPEANKPEANKPEANKPEANKTTAAAPPPPGFLKESVKPIDVIVVADTDFLQDRLWVHTQDFFGQKLVTPVAGNGDFVLDALDSLSGSDALVGLRSRGQSARPFALVERIRAEADARYLAKEKELQDRLKDTEKKLASLQKEAQPGGGRQILSADQQRELDNFRAEALETRQSLRAVQHALREDIDRLDGWLKFVNIGLVPLLIALAAIIVAWARALRRRRRHGAG
jgi:ABC-type uncharacterized transport system involved in gliding motility auxiliary subunit